MTKGLLRGAVFVLAAAVATAAATDAPAAPADLTATLARVREQRNVQLTTTGRRSGKPHTVTVWFMVDGPVVYLNTLDPGRDWVRNAKKTPTVRLDFGSAVLEGELRTVTDPALQANIVQALRDKYWVAWAGGLVGQGPQETYVIEGLRPAGS